MSFKIICYGEALWDRLPGGNRIGGALLNVSYHLHQLKANTALVSRVGKDKWGVRILQFMEENGMEGIVQTDAIHPTGIVRVTIDKYDEVSYDIIEGASWDYISYTFDLEKLVQDSEYLVFGTLALRNEVSRSTLYQLIDRPIKKVLDVNLRSPFYSKKLLEDLLKKVDIVKMNENELEKLSAWWHIEGDSEIKMKRIAKRFSLDVLLITLGSRGASLWIDGHILFQKSNKIKVKDTVGSGDAFLAGFLSKYVADGNVDKALAFAVKMGGFVAQRQGGCPEYLLEEVQ